MCFFTIKSYIIRSDFEFLSQFLGVSWKFYFYISDLQHQTSFVYKQKTLEFGEELIVECLQMQFWAVSLVWINKLRRESLVTILLTTSSILEVIMHIQMLHLIIYLSTMQLSRYLLPLLSYFYSYFRSVYWSLYQKSSQSQLWEFSAQDMVHYFSNLSSWKVAASLQKRPISL